MEKLGSSLKVSVEGFVVGTTCWGYLENLTENTYFMPQAAGKGHSVLLSNRFCRGEKHHGKGCSI